MTDATQTCVLIQENTVPIRTNAPVEHQIEVMKPTAAVKRGSRKTRSKKRLAQIAKIGTLGCCGCSTILMLLACLVTIPIIQIVMGWRYADECPVNWYIPQYSFFAGIFGLVRIGLVVLEFVLAQIILFVILKDDQDSLCQIAGICCVFGTKHVIRIVLICFFGWFIAGCFWVFGVWDQVQYSDSTKSSYCHPTLYRLNLVLSTISLSLSICCYCLRTPTADDQTLDLTTT